jgi:mannitol-1-phosphate 5-dehydrogenase
MNNVHFGAGNIGRGFIGWLLNKQGVQVTFVDVDETVVQAIKQRQSYDVEILSDPRVIEHVDGVNALSSRTQEAAVIAAIQQADLITTSVGVSILPLIAPLLAKALEVRTSNKPLHVIACENALSASSLLQKEVETHLKQPLEQVAFVNTAVDRIVPLQQHVDPLFVQVEPFFEWVIETKNMLTTLALTDVHFVEELQPYIERKLFTVNTGHCATAYYGHFKGYKTINQAIGDEDVSSFVRSVLAETSEYLMMEHGFDAAVQEQYVTQTIERFSNQNIVDEVHRVGRNPLRKLSFDDRFVKPARELSKQGIQPVALATAIAYGLCYSEATDPDVQLMQERLSTHLSSAISVITGIAVTDPLHPLITTAYHRIHQSS